MVSWSVYGLKRKLTDVDFIDCISEFDIVFLNETWLNENDFCNLGINGYESDHIYGVKAKNSGRGRYSGGISVYYRSSLKPYIKIEEKSAQGFIWIQVDQDLFPFDEHLYFGHVYLPHNKSGKAFRELYFKIYKSWQNICHRGHEC